MKNLILKILPIALAVVLLQLAVTTESKAAPPAWGCGSGGSHYVVCYGDTLFSIGRQFNKDPYCIAHHNGLDPDWIYAGQVIYIPGGCGPYPWWAHHQNSCWGDCGQGWHESSYNGCGQDDCYGDGYDHNSNWNCGNDCYNGGYDHNNNCGNDCYNGGYDHNNNCGNDCYNGGWGYDRTGYYYDHYNSGYQRYSYTCGYGGNCY
ncbi:MAG: LysM peptidoglycan-binding domain-containing protein [Anaerolineae bacterium]